MCLLVHGKSDERLPALVADMTKYRRSMRRRISLHDPVGANFPRGDRPVLLPNHGSVSGRYRTQTKVSATSFGKRFRDLVSILFSARNTTQNQHGGGGGSEGGRGRNSGGIIFIFSFFFITAPVLSVSVVFLKLVLVFGIGFSLPLRDLFFFSSST